MIWVTWRQHRLSILAGLVVLLGLGGLLISVGLSMHHGFDQLGLNQCAAPVDSTCPDAARQFTQLYQSRRGLLPLVLLLPALVGLFWGAPLVSREVEQGTHRLAWMQSVSRARWLLVKVVALAGVTVIAVGLFTWMLTWWISPLDAVRHDEFDPGMFDLVGLVPVAYALAALALGIAVGSVTKKVLPALAITLVLFGCVRFGVEEWVRPHFMEPVTATFAMPDLKGGDVQMPVGWYLVQQTVDRAGNVLSDGVGFERDAIERECPEVAAQMQPPVVNGAAVQPAAPVREAIAACSQRMGFHVEAVYQPEDRFWRFQITEALLYLALAGALLGGSIWWIRHRIT
jgi:hypothetical protein